MLTNSQEEKQSRSRQEKRREKRGEEGHSYSQLWKRMHLIVMKDGG